MKVSPRWRFASHRIDVCTMLIAENSQMLSRSDPSQGLFIRIELSTLSARYLSVGCCSGLWNKSAWWPFPALFSDCSDGCIRMQISRTTEYKYSDKLNQSSLLKFQVPVQPVLFRLKTCGHFSTVKLKNFHSLLHSLQALLLPATLPHDLIQL